MPTKRQYYSEYLIRIQSELEFGGFKELIVVRPIVFLMLKL